MKKSCQGIFNELKKNGLKSVVINPVACKVDRSGPFSTSEVAKAAMQEAYEFLIREKDSDYKIIFAAENDELRLEYEEEALDIYRQRDQEEKDPVKKHIYGNRKLPRDQEVDKKAFTLEPSQLVNELLQMAELDYQEKEPRSLKVEIGDEAICPRLQVNSMESSTRSRDSLIKFCVTIGAPELQQVAICMHDLGAEESLISERIFKWLREGEDYEHLKQVPLVGAGGTELKTIARIKIHAHAGMRLKPYLEPIEFIASISSDIGNSYDIIYSLRSMKKLGTVHTIIKPHDTPVIMIENTEGVLRVDGETSEPAKTVLLDIVPIENKPLRAINSLTIGAGEAALVDTNNHEASQIFSCPNSSLSVNELQRNFEMVNGKPVRKQGRRKVLVRNTSNRPIDIKKNQTVCLEIYAKDGIVCRQDSKCGRRLCPCSAEAPEECAEDKATREEREKRREEIHGKRLLANSRNLKKRDKTTPANPRETRKETGKSERK